MSCNLVHTISLVIILSCVISLAKNTDDNSVNSIKNVTDHQQQQTLDNKMDTNIYSEGSVTKKQRIYGRKEAKLPTPSDNSTVSDPVKELISQSSSSNSPSESNVENINSNSTVPSITISPIIPSSSSTTTQKPKIKHTTIIQTSTKLPPKKKPTVVYSADDNAEILQSEKRINYNTTTMRNQDVPKIEADTDRRIEDEARRQHRLYVLYMGLFFAIPCTFAVLHLSYRKIKAYLETVHYSRVDFLVDGMYIS